MPYSISLPRRLEIGANAIQQLPSVLAGLACSRPLIVTDAMMVELGYVERLGAILAEADIAYDVFDQTVPEPTASSIQAGVAMARDGNYDSIIAIGGGSPIDSAKAIAILGKHGGEIADYKVPRVVNETGLPVIAIPTTAGTGSEATRFTVITDDSSGGSSGGSSGHGSGDSSGNRSEPSSGQGADEKLLCMGLGFLPVAALVDYTLTLSLPPRTTADTGIDALTHAIEAYVSKKANAYSDTQALAAMRLLAPNIRAAFHDGNNEQAREAMMLGATLAGVAFSNASVALVHGMSRPIGAFFHVPHGLSNAMLLPAVTRFSMSGAEQRYAKCAVAMGIASEEDSEQTALDNLLTELVALNAELQVPSLAEFGVNRADFDAVKLVMAEQAVASGSPGNNPRVPSIPEILQLYDQLWDAD